MEAELGVSRQALVVTALLAAAGGGIAAGLLLTEDNSSSSGAVLYVYPKAARDQILKSCENTRSHDACVCVLHAFEKTMRFETYQKISREGVGLTTRDAWAAFGRESGTCPTS